MFLGVLNNRKLTVKDAVRDNILHGKDLADATYMRYHGIPQSTIRKILSMAMDDRIRRNSNAKG